MDTTKNNEIQMSVIDFDRPRVPDLTETSQRGKNYVYYGEDNKLPQVLKECVQGSATMGTIVNGFTDYICGDGVEIGATLKRFEEQINTKGETIEDIVRMKAYDLVLYGGFADQIIYTKVGTIAEMYSLDFEKVRSDKYNTHFFYSNKWEKWGQSGEVLEFPKFDRKAFTADHPSQVFYFKNGARTTYPLPMYIGALKDILVEIECSRYNLTSISRGFMARYVLNFPNGGMLNDEQKGAIEDGIRAKFCGTETDSNFMVYFANGSDKIEVGKIDADDTNERFVTTKKDARENIYTAFRCTPNLFGLPSETTGFNSQEYSQAFKLFQKTTIAPLQKAIENSFDKVFGEGALRIKPFTITFE